MKDELKQIEKTLIFWASFLALAACGFGFSYRVMVLGQWGAEFGLDGKALGNIFGASLWPIAITMILFSLIVDKIGYKISIYGAFVLQAASVYLTYTAGSAKDLWIAAFFAGLGHGIVEAVINPVCASIYTKNKSTMLNILHAAWPAGLVGGGTLVLLFGGLGWKINALWMIIPVIAYGAMYAVCRFPVNERVKANVPYVDMLKEVGFLGAFLASSLLFYEIYRVATATEPTNLIWISLGFGVLAGGAFGAYTRTLGKPLFFIMCVLMIPLATTELGTDAWIKELMTPVLKGSFNLDAGWAIVTSAFIMMTLRFFAGVLLHRFSPPTVLVISSFFSMVGLLMLSGVSGMAIILAFVLYAVGQTFYWPTVLGFVSEQYPRGGALTLNTVSAIGLLSVGIIGTPIMGAFYDSNLSKETTSISQEIHDASKTDKTFFGVSYEGVDRKKLAEAGQAVGKTAEIETAIDKAGRGALRTTALAFPLTMGIGFAIISLWFRSRGGYKQIHLEEAEASEPGF